MLYYIKNRDSFVDIKDCSLTLDLELGVDYFINYYMKSIYILNRYLSETTIHFECNNIQIIMFTFHFKKDSLTITYRPSKNIIEYFISNNNNSRFTQIKYPKTQNHVYVAHHMDKILKSFHNFYMKFNMIYSSEIKINDNYIYEDEFGWNWKVRALIKNDR